MTALRSKAEFLAKVWNHPEVLPWVSLGMPEELTEENAHKILEKGALFLDNEYGGFLLIPGENDVYDVHTQFLPEGRGSVALHFARDSIRKVFVETPCLGLRTFVADDNQKARMFSLMCGFVEVLQADVNGISGKIMLLTLKKWVVDTCRPH